MEAINVSVTDSPPRLMNTPELIEYWLIERVAQLARVDRDAIESTQPFSYYALDSVDAAGLTAELEDALSIDLEPTLLWDYPTIESLALYLAQEMAR